MSAAPCILCGAPAETDAVNAGGDLGVVHHACFCTWDREAEAFESGLLMGCDPRMLVAEVTATRRR